MKPFRNGINVYSPFSSVKMWKVKVLVAQSCLPLCNCMDYSPPGSSVCGILQTRILEWVAISFSSRSSWPREGSQISCIGSRFFTLWATYYMLSKWWLLFSDQIIKKQISFKSIRRNWDNFIGLGQLSGSSHTPELFESQIWNLKEMKI